MSEMERLRDEPCVDRNPRWRRRVNDFHRNSRIFQWGFWPAFWFSVHRAYNRIVFGDGWSTDWGHGHASVMAVHRWFCRRWVPANRRYLDGLGKS